MPVAEILKLKGALANMDAEILYAIRNPQCFELSTLLVLPTFHYFTVKPWMASRATILSSCFENRRIVEATE